MAGSTHAVARKYPRDVWVLTDATSVVTTIHTPNSPHAVQFVPAGCVTGASDHVIAVAEGDSVRPSNLCSQLLYAASMAPSTPSTRAPPWVQACHQPG